MALDASVSRRHIIHFRRIQDVGARWMRYMLAPWPVAALATYVPFCDLLGVNIIIDGVAAIARWTGRPLHIV